MAHLIRLNAKSSKHNMFRPSEKDFTPLKWDNFFDEFKDVTINGDIFRLYLSGTEGPMMVLLHGGGYSGLTWALFTKEILKRIKCRIVAMDLRGHGETHTAEEENLSLEYMTRDILSVVNEISDPSDHIVFIGHSMGGALAVHCAQKLEMASTLCVIDVVEGTALESLTNMQSFLRGRPTSFPSIEYAIQWCYKNGQTQNLAAARISMPGQIKNMKTGKLAASEIPDSKVDPATLENHNHAPVFKSPAPVIDAISEEVSENDVEASEVPTPAPLPEPYVWRINLSKTEVYWRDWFNGLSQEFLSCPVPKLLLLANIHGLDTKLTVGQMQGKFQMQVLPRCGHAIHEDLPDKVADLIATFLIRHKLTTAVDDYVPMFPC